MTTTDRTARVVVFAGITWLVTLFAACGVEVDVTGKTCPCPSGYFCDVNANRCVTTLPEPIQGEIDASAPVAPPAPACTDATCKCETNPDCADPKRGYCGSNKTCVECLAAPTDTCTAGGFCNEQNQCTVGCKGDGDCSGGQHCQSSTHRCVDCLSATDCGGPPKTCSPSGKCVDSCSGNGTACGTEGNCCGGFCVSLKGDVLNCGACGTVCSTTNGSPTCADGHCTWTCADGYAHCKRASDNTGCETNIRTVDNCGGCGVNCTDMQVVYANNIACAGTTCTYGSCQQGHFDEDRDPNNGCETECGGGNDACCPGPGRRCNDGSACKSNGKCQP